MSRFRLNPWLLLAFFLLACLSVYAQPNRWGGYDRFKVGDPVLYSGSGKMWVRGTIAEIGTDTRKGKYLIKDGEGWTDWASNDRVTTLERQAYWTEFFLGDWALNVPMSAVDRIQDNDVYRVYSGGAKLPPLRIKADGTYSWVTTKSGGGTEVVTGRWIANPNAPGVILKGGEASADWYVYNNNSEEGRPIYKRDHIYVSSDCCPAKQGFRVGQK